MVPPRMNDQDDAHEAYKRADDLASLAAEKFAQRRHHS
jgi:hypothetical protein